MLTPNASGWKGHGKGGKIPNEVWWETELEGSEDEE